MNVNNALVMSIRSLKSVRDSALTAGQADDPERVWPVVLELNDSADRLQKLMVVKVGDKVSDSNGRLGSIGGDFERGWLPVFWDTAASDFPVMTRFEDLSYL